jgi:hypothetical protein
MLATALIVFRETLEAALFVSSWPRRRAAWPDAVDG